MLSASLVAPTSRLEPAATATVSSLLVEALARLGTVHAFGVMGGAIAPFFRAVVQSSIQVFHVRHEAGAAFAAIEASLCARRPVLVFTTAGPGLSNALTGMLAARWEGAHVVFVSAGTSAAHRGRAATQETGSTSLGSSALAAAGGLHYSVTVEHAAQLGAVLSRLAQGLANPAGFVAHISLPIDLQAQPCALPPPAMDAAGLVPSCSPSILVEHAALFAASPPVLWLGHGARHAAAPIRLLAERLGARVMCTARGKGIFPERHPRFLGVTGIGGNPEVEERLVADRPAYTLVLGTRMGESSSFWASELTPREAFVHVDLDAAVLGAAYPGVRTHGVVAELGGYVRGLLQALPYGEPRVGAASRGGGVPVTAPPPRAEGLVRPQVLLAEIQRVLVDGSDAWLMAESGNSFCWASHLLRCDEPGRYRVSTGFGSMGHATTGVVGAALARGGKAVALVGDGAMLMMNELHAAVQHGAAALWIILNDSCYLMCAQGMAVMGWQPMSCELPPVDFVALARALGATGERVDSELELGPALARAAAARGPHVLDVRVDPREVPPSGRRNRSLMQQGYTGDGARGAR